MHRKMVLHLFALWRGGLPRPDKDRLGRLAKWSVTALLIGMIGAVTSGSMLGSLEKPCEAKPNGYQDDCAKTCHSLMAAPG